MFNEWEIKNFKSIKHLKLSSKRINIFIGEPNTGKSNILEAIGLLSHVCYGHIEKFIRFENMTDLFYDHILEEPIEIKFADKSLEVKFENGVFFGTFYLQQRTQIHGPFFRYSYSGGAAEDAWNVPILRQEFPPFKFYRFVKRVDFLNKKSEFLNPPDGDNLLHVIMARRELRRILHEIFGRFGYRTVFKPSDGKIEVQKEFEDIIVSFPYSLASETLQRIVFYLTAIYSNKDSIITFEEPEAHAFPYYTKYLAERIAMDANKNQYFITTHNPYFLISVLEKTPKDEIATFLTYIENYQTKVKTLTDEEKREILEMGTDAFFNIEKFLEHRD